MGVGLIGIELQCLQQMSLGLVIAAHIHQQEAEVGVGVGLIGGKVQCPQQMSHGLVMPPLVHEQKAQVAMRHPTMVVSRNGRPVQGLCIRIHPALTPAQDEKCRQQHAGQQRLQGLLQPILQAAGYLDEPGCGSRHGTYAGEILKVVGHERVTEGIDVEEAQGGKEGD